MSADHVKSAVEKIAPVQGYTPGIPWEMHLRAYDGYRARWGEQKALIDLEGRNCRGGFSVGELDMFIPGWRDELSERTQLLKQIADLKERATKAEAERDEALEALKPFGGEFASTFVNENGWAGPMNKERIVDWFGPSDFRCVATLLARSAQGGSDAK